MNPTGLTDYCITDLLNQGVLPLLHTSLDKKGNWQLFVINSHLNTFNTSTVHTRSHTRSHTHIPPSSPHTHTHGLVPRPLGIRLLPIYIKHTYIPSHICNVLPIHTLTHPPPPSPPPPSPHTHTHTLHRQSIVTLVSWQR